MIRSHKKLSDADVLSIKKNLSQPNGRGDLGVDAPKLWEQYCQQQGENVLI